MKTVGIALLVASCMLASVVADVTVEANPHSKDGVVSVVSSSSTISAERESKLGVPIGLAHGDFPNGQLSSSAAYPYPHHECDVKYARLGNSQGAGAFCPRRSNRDQYAEVDFGSAQILTGVATQGRNPFSEKYRGAREWLRGYIIRTSLNGISWTPYQNGAVLKGNKDGTNVVSHQLKPTKARYVRLYAYQWNNRPSFRFELYTAEAFKLPSPGKPLGIASGAIKDAQISASSEYNCAGCCSPSKGRLNSKAGAGAWCAAGKDKQYIQVDLNGAATLTGITTQGRAGRSRQWVKSYQIEYSLDGNHWTYYTLARQVKTFRGNSDNSIKVTHVFVHPFRARFVRIRVKSYHHHVSMRFELYSRNGVEKPHLGLPAGMANGAIRDDQIFASTYYPTSAYDCHEKNARLNHTSGAGGWVAAKNSLGQYLSIDVGVEATISGVSTQGRSALSPVFSRSKNWVTAYKLAYSRDGLAWNMYTVNGGVHIFRANYDSDTTVSHVLKDRIRARYVRFYPLKWNGRIAMRAEVYTTKTLTRPATPPMIRITGRQLLASSYWGRGVCKGCGTPNNGMLDNKKGAGAWISGRAGLHQFLEADFGGPGIINGVSTQGRFPNATVKALKDQWVRSYAILYSLDGRRWSRYTEGARSNFRANDDPNTKVFHFFKNPFKARLVRLYVTNWHNAIAMRAGFFSYTGIAPPKVGRSVGVQNGELPAGNLYASSVFATRHFDCAPRFARLDGDKGAGGWQAAVDKAGEYIEVDLGTKIVINGLATQGRNPESKTYPNSEAWVTSYKLYYSNDGKTFRPYKEHDMIHIFRGNFDNVRAIYHSINPIEARYVRLVVVGFHGHPALRFDLFAGKKFDRPSLGKAFGMASGNIEDDQITASTEFSPCKGCCDAANARLNSRRGAGSWCAKTNKGSQWVQVDLGLVSELQGISTQGRNPVGKVYRGAKQWIEEYQLSYSLDGKNWNTYEINNKAVTFRGNQDPYTVVSHVLDQTVKCRFVRIYPTKYEGHMSLRMELYGIAGVNKRRLGHAIGVGKIDPSQWAASSYYPTPNFACTPRYAVLNSNKGAGGWVSRYNRLGQWLQVDLGKQVSISGVATQGRNTKSQYYQGAKNWVKAYKLRFSQDGENWVESKQNFVGNFNSKTVVPHKLVTPIRARFVRFLPTQWRGTISMRVELYTTDKNFKPLTYGKSFNLENRKKWVDQLFTSSSIRPRPAQAFNARLHSGKGKALGAGAWVGLRRNNQWVQIYLKHRSRVTGIVVQGRALNSRFRPNNRNWVTKFQVQYSDNGLTFKTVKNARGKPHTFRGNADPVTQVKYLFAQPIQARFVRIVVKRYYGTPALRFDLFGEPNVRKGSLDQVVSLGVKGRSASSTYKSVFDVKNSNLLSTVGGGAWCAKRARRREWVQVDLGKEHIVNAIATQGRANRRFWVKRYTVSYSLDGDNWTTLRKGRKVIQMHGNRDGDSVSYQALGKARFRARYVRLSPTSWNRHICMRFNVYGKATKDAHRLGDLLTFGGDQYKASSQYNSRHGARYAPLFSTKNNGAWSARKNNRKQWLQIDFDTKIRVAGIATQGRRNYSQWVTKYKAKCSPNGKDWEWITDKNGKTAVFNGNRNRNTVVSHALFAPQTCVSFRVYPVSWKSHISMRLGLYGANTNQPAYPAGEDDSESSSGSESSASASSGSDASSSSSSSSTALDNDEAVQKAKKAAAEKAAKAAEKKKTGIKGEPDDWPAPKAKPGREGADHAVPVERKGL